MSHKPLSYAELTPDMIAVLKLERALEHVYPQNGDRASRILEGHEAWRMKQSRVMNRSNGKVPGIVYNMAQDDRAGVPVEKVGWR